MMTNDKQVQKAGDNSVQTQIDQQIINYGVTEARAREIFNEMEKRALEESFAQGIELGQSRIDAFARAVIPKIQEIDEKCQSFSDPAFQVLLKKAQITAACSDREADYSILSELLVHRIKNRHNIKKKASIAKAVEIIDQIDDDSLCGLTVFLAVQHFIPITGNISEGLQVLNDLYSKLELETLPENNLWIDNLSVLGAITVTHFATLKGFEEFMFEHLDGYACCGIKKDSAEYKDALVKLQNCQIDQSIFVDNELIEGYVRLNIPQKAQISKLCYQEIVAIDGKLQVANKSISSQQIMCLESIFDLYSKEEQTMGEVKSNFNNRLRSFECISRVCEWWNSIGQNISLTSVGRAIAHTNAKRYDSTLPDLD